MNLLNKSREVFTGTIKTTPRKLVPDTGVMRDGVFIPSEFTPIKRELILDGRRGQLLGFGVEGEREETYCFGLVQFPDGTFDTLSVTCIALTVDLTPINA